MKQGRNTAGTLTITGGDTARTGRYVSQAEKAAVRAEQSAAVAEAWAVGEKGGAPVGSTDETFLNNARHFAEQAAASVTFAQAARTAAESAKDDAEAAADSVSQSAAQIGQNASDISDLKSQIDGYEDIVGGVFRYEKGGSGWFTAQYNLKAGSTYTMKNTGSTNISPIRSMIGETVIDVFNSENLQPGKTLLITPTADAEVLSVYFKGSTGTHAFEIYKNDSYIGEAINNAKTITVAPSGADYASLAEAIEFCSENGISTIHVLKGTYDILAEHQALHPDDWDTRNSGRGIIVSHGMTLIFDPQAFVTCHYTGDSEDVQKYYSAFDVRFGGATFIGLNISCSRIKYCVHDDQWTWTQPTVSRFIGCKMELDNRESVTNPTLQCIGGGFGVQSSVEVRDCYFIGHEAGEQYESPLWVSYHSSPSENSQSKILITGCYFDGNGTAGLLTNGTTQQKTLAVVANNRLGSQLYLAQGYEDQFEVVAFNNNEVDIEERLADLDELNTKASVIINTAINTLQPSATAADVGKALIVKTVDPQTGKPSVYEYGESGGGGGGDVTTAQYLAIFPTSDASGNFVSVQDGGENLPLKSGTFAIDYTATGRTSLIISVCGKNMFDPNTTGREHTTSGSTIVSNDDYRSVRVRAQEGVIFTFFGTRVSPGSIAISALNASGEILLRNGTSGGNVVTLTAPAGTVEILASVNSPTAFADLQLEIGNATEYTPYVGIEKTVDWSSVGAVYGGIYNSITGTLTSNLDADGTPLAEPVNHQIQPTEITTEKGINNIWTNAGGSTITYRADVQLYVDNKIAELQAVVLENMGG